MRLGAVLSVLLAVEVVWGLSRIARPASSRTRPRRRQRASARIGAVLFTQHAFAFEATSILILVAMVGAVVLARRER